MATKATTTAEPVSDDEQQPERFPVTFDEWAAGQGAYARHLVAGYRCTVRARGDLLRKQAPDAWDKGFEQFKQS